MDAWAQFVVGPVLVLVLGWWLDHRQAKRIQPVAQQVNESHRTLTQNTNISDPPTVLDELHYLRDWTVTADDRFEDGRKRMRRSDDAIGLPVWPSDPAA